MTDTTTHAASQQAPDEDFMPLLGIDHVEYYVGNARQAAYFYTKAFGFHVTAYSGPETKVRDRASWVLESGEARYVFTGAMDPDSFIARHAHEHGDGVRDVALRVPDLAVVVARLKSSGARLLNEPREGAGGHRYVFVHPASAGGVLLELIQEDES
jgi:4-hydroxyphenylpyruvate dioxygenase